ncbi:MAG: DUF3018 family protein [Chloroflexi bacterium]|nr:DUF3018 family protein [Chloroflexota bacterium]
MSNEARPKLGLPSDEEVLSYRDRGLHPVVLWLPSLGSEGFAMEVRHQAVALLAADAEEREVLGWLDSHFNDVLGIVEGEEAQALDRRP